VHGNEPSGFIKFGMFFGQLGVYYLFEKDCTPCSYPSVNIRNTVVGQILRGTVRVHVASCRAV
jgi:hypothetical protein